MTKSPIREAAVAPALNTSVAEQVAATAVTAALLAAAAEEEESTWHRWETTRSAAAQRLFGRRSAADKAAASAPSADEAISSRSAPTSPCNLDDLLAAESSDVLATRQPWSSAAHTGRAQLSRCSGPDTGRHGSVPAWPGLETPRNPIADGGLSSLMAMAAEQEAVLRQSVEFDAREEERFALLLSASKRSVERTYSRGRLAGPASPP